MFGNIYCKRLLVSARNRGTLIWTWIFPLMMATLFYFAFSGLQEADLLKTIPTGLVASEEYERHTAFRTALSAVSDPEEGFLELHDYDTREAAEEALKNGEIEGFISLENGPCIQIRCCP